MQTILETKHATTLAELQAALSHFEARYGSQMEVVFPDGLPLLSASCIATRQNDGTTMHEVVLSDAS